ncbi:helix-turn-helix domain-containing protein [Halorubrum sp. JWXQ-INN 858]|uniref:winged helix-turn-helix domain-containing protein n=1 Tax=Halorubrum sp. JWXQ-INN 858 TaxID=2690782 RepID=UPI001358C1EA|nr:winged helix-turn-helix domain-containing protein [Halorubrum sp. JWXQ-INN 858]MWV65461.1 helix-turn-helix domain-containing protein [Halorubrum sp. JWXQ-INN 858]
MDPDWDAIGYVISSKYRIAVCERLEGGPSTPTEIADRKGMSITHVSRALRNLEERSLVELLVPDDQRKQRIYDLTERGSGVWGDILRTGLVETEAIRADPTDGQ